MAQAFLVVDGRNGGQGGSSRILPPSVSSGFWGLCPRPITEAGHVAEPEWGGTCSPTDDGARPGKRASSLQRNGGGGSYRPRSTGARARARSQNVLATGTCRLAEHGCVDRCHAKRLPGPLCGLRRPLALHILVLEGHVFSVRRTRRWFAD